MRPLLCRLLETLEGWWWELAWWARRLRRPRLPSSAPSPELRLLGVTEATTNVRRLTDEVEGLGRAWGRLPPALRARINAEIKDGLWELRGSWECGSAAPSSTPEPPEEPEGGGPPWR